MAKELRAGVGVSGDTSRTVVFEFAEGRMPRLVHIDEFERDRDNAFWYLDSLLGVRKGRIAGRVARAGVALDHRSLYLHVFPLDTSLSRSEENEHIWWELANFYPDATPGSHLNDVHYMRTRTRDQISDTLVVSVQRTVLYGIQKALSDRGIELISADANFFGALVALANSYPETKQRAVVICCMEGQTIEAGVVQNGRLVSFERAIFDNPPAGTDLAQVVESVRKDFPVSDLFVYGSDAMANHLPALGDSLAVAMLNPFRRLEVTSSLREFDAFAGLEHRFAAAVGIALRRV
jgi:hypothetical protein